MIRRRMRSTNPRKPATRTSVVAIAKRSCQCSCFQSRRNGPGWRAARRSSRTSRGSATGGRARPLRRRSRARSGPAHGRRLGLHAPSVGGIVPRCFLSQSSLAGRERISPANPPPETSRCAHRRGCFHRARSSGRRRVLSQTLRRVLREHGYLVSALVWLALLLNFSALAFPGAGRVRAIRLRATTCRRREQRVGLLLRARAVEIPSTRSPTCSRRSASAASGRTASTSS